MRDNGKSQLPGCRHRGAEIAHDQWSCRSPWIVAPAGIVGGDVCRHECAYVDFDNQPPAVNRQGVADSELSRLFEVAVRPELLSIGMISAPRPVRTVEQSLSELRRAGFAQQITVYEEPGTAVSPAVGVRVETSDRRLGMWRNWLRAARGMLAHSDSPFILICEDDIRLCPAAAAALQHAFDTLPLDDWGYASLYTPVHNTANRRTVAGWQPIDLGAAAWGALAYCFSRKSLEQLLEHYSVQTHRSDRETDTVVSAALLHSGLRCYYHIPSLGEHAGSGLSSVGHAANPGHAADRFSPEYAGYIDVRHNGPEAIHNVDSDDFNGNSHNSSRHAPSAISPSNGSAHRRASTAVRAVMVSPGLLSGGAEHWIVHLLTHSDPQKVCWQSLLLADPKGAAEPFNAKRVLNAGVSLLGGPLLPNIAEPVDLVDRYPDISTATGVAVRDADVVVTWGTCDVVAEIARRFSGPIVWVSQGRDEWTRRNAATVAPHITHWSAVSQWAAEVFAEPEAARVIYNGVNPARCLPTASRSTVRRAWGIGDDQFAAGYMGRISPEKNPLAVVHGVSQLPAQFRAVVVGGLWQSSPFREEALAIGGDRVTLQDHVDAVGDVLQALDAFVLASPSEGCSLAMAEAWLAGIPVVATQVGVIPELQKTYGPLVIPIPVDPTPRQTAAAIRQAAELGRDSQIVRRAKRVARQHLTVEALCNSWGDYIAEIAETHPASPRIARETI